MLAIQASWAKCTWSSASVQGSQVFICGLYAGRKDAAEGAERAEREREDARKAASGTPTPEPIIDQSAADQAHICSFPALWSITHSKALNAQLTQVLGQDS